MTLMLEILFGLAFIIIILNGLPGGPCPPVNRRDQHTSGSLDIPWRCFARLRPFTSSLLCPSLFYLLTIASFSLIY